MEKELKNQQIDTMDNKDKAIVITGANGGIGIELVKYLLEHDYHNLACVCHDDGENLIKIFKEVNLNHETRVYKLELTDEEEIKLFRASISSSLGDVWAVINLAGYSSNGMSWNLSKEEFTKAIDNNLLSAFLCNKEFIPQMRQQKGGRIINISSVTAYKGVIGACHYASAKAGLSGLTKSMAMELAGSGVTVNSLVLGYFNYGMINQIPKDITEKIKDSIPMKRFGTIEEIGGMIRLLLSDESSYITGQSIHINGGLY